jgi:DNA mismatch repair protein MutL
LSQSETKHASEQHPSVDEDGQIVDNQGQSDSLIRQLPPEISNKIAAGEVIQRPSSVVKELVDNAIDAGAEQIKIIIQQAGRTLIQVVDDGCGMSEGDLRPCFTQHATSKIQDIEDLHRIRTLGFRGEAMASIASVSQVTVKTKRPEDDAGWLYEIWGGDEKKREPVATDNGTSVSVRNLFFNVPARRQFLKTDATEFRHILRTVQQLALAHTEIAFELHADGDEIYQLPPQELSERIVAIFGKNYRASLIKFEEKTSYVRIYGVLADPKLTKRSRGEQFLFVNGRPFQHRLLTYSILSQYEPWTGKREYPFFALFLDIDPEQVDVNVHPAKSEVKFDDQRSILKLSKSVIRKALNEHFYVPQVEDEDKPTKDSFTGFSTSFGDQKGQNRNRSSSDQNEPIRIPSRINFQESSSRVPNQAAGDLYDQPAEHSEEGRPRQSGESDKPQRSRDRGFWQLHNSFIITQTRTGMCIVDQHAAHKRIIYERILSATESGLPSTQQLLFSQTIEFSASDFSLLEELHPIIQKMGFNVQLVSGNTAIMQGVPADINIGDEQQVLRQILNQYRELDQNMRLDARRKLAIAFAQKTSIPRGKVLTDMEMETIIDQLFSCEEPYLDPLKKPTIHYLPLDEIKARFR